MLRLDNLIPSHCLQHALTINGDAIPPHSSVQYSVKYQQYVNDAVDTM
jgi:hypothetical protein